jgi:hypothetical protein
LGPITEKLTGPGAKKIFGIRLLFAKVRPVKLNIGYKSLQEWDGNPEINCSPIMMNVVNF